MLPEPMLAKPGPLPTRAGWAFEAKWDGFRAVLRSGPDFAVRSRRAWSMTELLPEFAAVPLQGIFDGELVAFDADGLPSFDLLCGRMLHGDRTIPVSFVVFDLLELETKRAIRWPYSERREQLEALELPIGWHLSPRFSDGEALWVSVVERGLEGVVAKRLREPYKPGERLWIKRKNPAWKRYAAERESAMRSHRRRARV